MKSRNAREIYWNQSTRMRVQLANAIEKCERGSECVRACAQTHRREKKIRTRLQKSQTRSRHERTGRRVPKFHHVTKKEQNRDLERDVRTSRSKSLSESFH